MTSSQQPQPNDDALTQFMTAGLQDHSVWETDDLAAMLSHQLGLALEQELPFLSGLEADQIHSLAEQADPSPHSFLDLLVHPEPPYDLLELVKQYAKVVRSQTDDPIFKQVVFVLYYASIAAAWLRHRRRSSSLDDDALCRGMRWSLDQPGLDPLLVAMFEETLADITGAHR